MHGVDLRFFDYEHLPEPMRSMSKGFHDLVHSMESRADIVDGAEFLVGMRKLLEAKDCFVRSIVPAPYKRRPQGAEQVLELHLK